MYSAAELGVGPNTHAVIDFNIMNTVIFELIGEKAVVFELAADPLEDCGVSLILEMAL